MSRPSRLLLRAFVVAVFIFLYAPIAVVVAMSMNDSRTNSLPWGGFTVRWYKEAAMNRDLWSAFFTSVELGLLTAAVCLILATALCLAFREQFRLKRYALYLVLLPMLVPSIVHGVSVMLYWRMLGLSLTVFSSAFVAHVTYVLPFTFLTIYPRVHNFNTSLEEAARDLGATEWMVFRRVVLPLIAPGLVSGGILAFIMSFDEFIRSLLLISNDSTLPMLLWAIVTNDLSPQPNAVAAMMVAFTAGMFAIWIFLQQRMSRSRPAAVSDKALAGGDDMPIAVESAGIKG